MQETRAIQMTQHSHGWPILLRPLRSWGPPCSMCTSRKGNSYHVSCHQGVAGAVLGSYGTL